MKLKIGYILLGLMGVCMILFVLSTTSPKEIGTTKILCLDSGGNKILGSECIKTNYEDNSKLGNILGLTGMILFILGFIGIYQGWYIKFGSD